MWYTRQQTKWEREKVRRRWAGREMRAHFYSCVLMQSIDLPTWCEYIYIFRCRWLFLLSQLSTICFKIDITAVEHRVLDTHSPNIQSKSIKFCICSPFFVFEICIGQKKRQICFFPSETQIFGRKIFYGVDNVFLCMSWRINIRNYYCCFKQNRHI